MVAHMEERESLSEVEPERCRRAHERLSIESAPDHRHSLNKLAAFEDDVEHQARIRGFSQASPAKRPGRGHQYHGTEPFKSRLAGQRGERELCGDSSLQEACGTKPSYKWNGRICMKLGVANAAPVPRLLAVFLLFISFASMPENAHGATFAGIGKIVGGDSGIHRLLLTTDENGAHIQRVLNDLGDPKEDTRGREPTIGVASWNSVEKFYYYAAAEDGEASAYITPYSYIGRDGTASKDEGRNARPTQRIIRGKTDTSFTLTSIQYNRVDAHVYGLITYSSGEHFMIKVLADTREGRIEETLWFEALLAVDYTHIVPGLSALNAAEQIYYAVGIRMLKQNGKTVPQGYLFALGTGMRATGKPEPASWIWERELPGVLTSLELDPTTGNIFGMLHNVSGHFLLHFDPSNVQKGAFGGRYRYRATPLSTNYWKPDPGRIFHFSPDTEVVFGIASYAPPVGIYGRESEADYFSVVYERGIENGTAFERFNIRDMNLANKFNQRVNGNVTFEDFEVQSVEYSMTSLKAIYTTIPIMKEVRPSAAHIQGEMLVTVVGEPFVDTGPQIRCRWRLLELGSDEYSGETVDSVHAYFVNSSVCVCVSPKLTTRSRGRMDLTLTGGDIWTQNTMDFSFFETTNRLPLIGSSKGGTLVQIKGLLLRDLPRGDEQYMSDRGKPSVMLGKVAEAQCEFGTPPEGYAFNDKAISTGDPMFQVQGNAPVSPIFNELACVNLTVGEYVDEVCTLSCRAPSLPHEQCDTQTDRKCNIFFRDCPDPQSGSYVKTWNGCKSLLNQYEQIPFYFTFFGQRISSGTWAFNGHESPIVEGCRFTADGSGIIIQFDLDTNKGRELGGKIDSSTIILNSAQLLGPGAYITYVLRNRILITLGKGSTATEESFLNIRPASLGALANEYRFVAGSFMMQVVTDEEKPRPSAHIVAPDHAAPCTRVRVHGSLSSISGGRALKYTWGLRASKCIDMMCLNSVVMDEKQQIWLLPAQRTLHQSDSAEINVENSLAVGFLELVTVNQFTWMLQTSNFFYKKMLDDPARKIEGVDEEKPIITCAEMREICKTQFSDYPVPCTERPHKCNKCNIPDAKVCPALSTLALANTQLHWTPGPKAKIMAAEFTEIPADEDFSLFAKIVLPDDRICCQEQQCLDRPTGSDIARILQVGSWQYETFSEGNSLASVGWSLMEIVPRTLSAGNQEDQHVAVTNHRDFSANIIDLGDSGVQMNAALLKIPKRILKFGHYYKATVEVKMMNPTRTPLQLIGSDASFLFVKRPVLIPKLIMREERPNGLVYDPHDHSFITLQGDPTFPVVISAKDTAGLSNIPDSAQITFRWSCRKWFKGDVQYWRYDRDIVPPDDRYISKCFFNNSVEGKPYPKTQAQRDKAFPCCNRSEISALSAELDDRTTYEFNLTISIVYATQPTSTYEFQGFRRITVQRQDSPTRDFFTIGRTIQVNLFKADTNHPTKITPDAPFVLYANIPKDSLETALETWNGKCEHPQRLGEPGCILELTEIAQGLDTSDELVTRSKSVLLVVSHPPLMSFKIQPNMVSSGNRFVFRLSIKTIELTLSGDVWRERGYSELQVEVNRAPRNSQLMVSPSKGIAFASEFHLEASLFEDDAEDHPLLFSFFYTVESSQEEVFISENTQESTLRHKFPMLENMALVAPCKPSDAMDGPCAILRTFVRVTDAHGAQTISDTTISLTLLSGESITYEELDNRFKDLRRQAFLMKDYLAMCNSIKASSLILQHSKIEPSVSAMNRKDPLSTTLKAFKEGLAKTLLDVIGFQDGEFLQLSPLMNAMVCSAIEEALSHHEALTTADFQKFYGLVTKMSKSIQNDKQSKDILQSILETAASLVKKNLARFSIENVARRRLLQIESDRRPAVENSFTFLRETIVSVCSSILIGATMDSSGTEAFDTSLFSLTCAKFYKSPSPNFKTEVAKVQKSDKCDAVTATMQDWSSDSDADLAMVVYKFNPVSFAGVKTGNGLIDGSVQQEYAINWPLHPRSCPVSIYHSVAGSIIRTPYRTIKIRSRVPLSAARQTFKREKNTFAFQDTIFSATCQQWYSSQGDVPGAWFAANSTASINASEPDFVCRTTHMPADDYNVPPPLATGEIDCKFVAIPDPPLHTPQSLYGVITEETDCEGEIDFPAKKLDGVDWKQGQFAFIETPPSPRKICDRCKVCGQLNDCVLTCSSKLKSTEQLDLCGVCGGVCTYEKGCNPSLCTQPYFRYLGNLYPNDFDVKPDGMTTGLLKKGAGCLKGGPDDASVDQPPANSPNGICRTLDSQKITARIERYPYNNMEKVCWENSPMVPVGSPDKLCQFQADSFRIDAPQGAIITLRVEALDENEEDTADGQDIPDLLLKYDPAGALTFAGNGSRVLTERGPGPGILNTISKFSYRPPLNWNSHFPPERRRLVRIKIQDSGIPAVAIGMRIRPVNDPPKIVASDNAYRVQEDRVTRIENPPVQIVDDAADVAGSNITVELRVLRTGASLRTSSTGKFLSRIVIAGSLAFVNGDLATLDYLGPENSNDEYNPKDEITVKVNDNGYGGEAPHNIPQTAELVVNVTTVKQNDPPIALIEREQVIFQDGVVKVRGAHIVDPDSFQHSDQLYESSISTEQGMLTINVLRINCTVLAPKPKAFTIPSVWKYVDQMMPSLDAIKTFGVGFLKLDGRPDRLKASYLTFQLDVSTLADVLAYSGVKIVLAIYKQDCYDINVDQGSAAQSGLSSSVGICRSSGRFNVTSLDCPIANQDSEFSYNTHKNLDSSKVAIVGKATFTARQREWIYANLDSSSIIDELRNSKRLMVCLRLDHDSEVNETMRFIAPVSTSAKPQSSLEETLVPRLDILFGISTNASYVSEPSRSNKKCFVEMTSGSGVRDVKFKAQAYLETSNKLVEEFEYGITGKYSNRLGGDVANVTFAVEDVSARASCQLATVFGEQACNQLNYANASIWIVPIKETDIPMRMQPWYEDRWIRQKSIEGSLPVIVQLEDCGNRGWEQECPYRLQIVPDTIEGEYDQGRLSCEISSRLGTVTIPEDLRAPLVFEKGSGFRDPVLRVTGFAPDVRKAIMEIVYHSQLDQHTQYANLYSEEMDPSNLACSRLCFINDIGPPTFLGVDEIVGCSKGCGKRIYERANKQVTKSVNGVVTVEERGIFLDDLTITLTDNGNTGIGLAKYTTLLLYNIYTIAVNDRPCIIFKGKISSGCRRECAHMGLPNNCYNSGLPFDLNTPFQTQMWEGQQDPILVGGLVSKVVDEYEYSRKECRTLLDVTLANRGDDVVDPTWLVECPRLNVRVAADQGAVALNSREFIELYLGADKTFASPIAFLGYPLDSNAAMRMIRYKMSEENPYFNSNQGTETVRLVVSDQGFSGSDTSGEFDGTASESVLTFEIEIKPVNNLPAISVPRATDSIAIDENVPTQMSTKAIPQSATQSEGLTVDDYDSNECVNDGQGFGTLTLELSVLHSRIYINPNKQDNLEPLPGIATDNLDFFVNPSCSESACAMRLSEESCEAIQECAWDSNLVTKTCRCKLVKRPGKKCSKIKIRGSIEHIKSAIKVVVYDPKPATNYLNFVQTPEILQIRVTDKRDPEDPNDSDVSCGETIDFSLNQFLEAGGWIEAQASVRTNPISQPAIMTIDPYLVNSQFEEPMICEGNKDCEDFHLLSLSPPPGAQCTGVLPIQKGNEPSSFGWSIQSGITGISFDGWRGDVKAAQGQQHLYLSPSIKIPAVVNQTINSLVLGARYKVAIKLGARTSANRGTAFKVTMSEELDYPWADLLPTIEETLVVSLPGRETFERESAEFFAYRTSYPLELRAYLTPAQTPSFGRLVFVDDVQIRFVKYNILEGDDLAMKSVRIDDADYIQGVIDVMRSNGLDFDMKVTIEAKYGRLVLITDECSVAPPNEFMDDDKRIAWGIKCWEFTGDELISTWANTTLFRPNCPDGWAGQGTQVEPCINVPLKKLNTTFATPYLPQYYFLSNPGQAQIPQKYMELVGKKEGIEQVFAKHILYRPDPYFNTDNRGKEILKLTSNDLGNYAGDSLNPNIRVQNFVLDIYAVNNAPNITITKSNHNIEEDTELVLEGISVTDPDVNELKCSMEPCDSVEGFIVMRIGVNNGSIAVSSETVLRSIQTIRDSVLKPFLGPDRTLQECVMLLSCTQYSGYFSLGSSTLKEFCLNDAERCSRLTLYCTLSEMMSRGMTRGMCLDRFNQAGTKLVDPQLIAADRTLQDAFWKVLSTNQIPLVSIDSNSITLAGTLLMLNTILMEKVLTYKPNANFNGLERCTFEVSDIGNQGIGAPCDAPGEIPRELMFDYCKKQRPHWPLLTTQSFTIQVEAINNKPYVKMYDTFGSTVIGDSRSSMETFKAEQNITRVLNRMEVVDVDFLETPKCMMTVRLETSSGGQVSFNVSKAPKLSQPGRLSQNPMKTEITANGELEEIQAFMSNIEYRSDAQFAGVESILLGIADRGCTGREIDAKSTVFESILLKVVVAPPTLCRFETCLKCVNNLNEACGWCPSSCKGRGKCKEAKGRGLGPKVGDCPAKCADGFCLTWNMCESLPDASWKIGAIGAPITFAAIVAWYFVFMWSRRHYGTFPLYVAKFFRRFTQFVRKLSFAPQEHARFGQLIYLILALCIGVIVSGLQVSPKWNSYPLGEATSFTLETDACNVLFVSDPTYSAVEKPKLETLISGNGSLFHAPLSDVVISTDFCRDQQFFRINNTRKAVERYTGYVCEIIIRIPKDDKHSIPAMTIINNGTKLTTISTNSDDQVVNFRPNVLTVLGTLVKINIFNLRLRKLQVKIERGDVRLHNVSFDDIDINTLDADVTLSVDSSVEVPIDVAYRQNRNQVCFVGASLIPDVFLLKNTCQERMEKTIIKEFKSVVVMGELQNRTYVKKHFKRTWDCTEDNYITLAPFKRNLQDPTSKTVSLRSNTGQIYFQSVPTDRVPPRSGGTALDTLKVYDGLSDEGFTLEGYENKTNTTEPEILKPVQRRERTRELDIEANAKTMLDARFHPGGAKGPKEEWFEMPLEGPSIPTGTFVWLSHYRYLVIPRNILKALSFGLLVPKEATTKVRLKPGFCPEFDYGSKRIGVQYPKRFLFREEKEKLFTKIDSNKNGVLDPIEFQNNKIAMLEAIEQDRLVEALSKILENSDQLFKAGCWKSRAFRLDCWLSENAAYLPEGWKDIRDKRTQEWASSISEAEMRVFFDVLDGSRDAEVSQDEFVKDFNEWTYFSVASMVKEYEEAKSGSRRVFKQMRNTTDDKTRRQAGGGISRRTTWEEKGIGNSNHLIKFYQLLFDTVKGIDRPKGSYIAFKPRIGHFIVFEKDAETGVTVPKQTVLQDYPLVIALLIFGLLVPALFALAFTLVIVYRARSAIKTFRLRKYYQEMSARRLLDCLRPGFQKEVLEEETKELMSLIYSKTNFFYFLDFQIGDPDQVASIWEQIKLTTYHMLVITVSFMPLLVFLIQWKDSRLKFECSSEPEPYLCVQKWSVPEYVVTIYITLFVAISALELYCHYSNLKWSFWRKPLRLTWYTVEILMILSSSFYLCVLVTWIFIGLFVEPSRFMPYVTGIMGAVSVVARYAVRTARENERTTNALTDRTERLTERGYGDLPTEAVVAILDKTLKKLLRQHKLTAIDLFNDCLIIFAGELLALSFLIISFHAFTDTTDFYVGSLNAVITASVLLAIDRGVNAAKDKEILAQDIAKMANEAVAEGVKTIQFLSKQVDMGALILKAAAKAAEEKRRRLESDAVFSEGDMAHIQRMAHSFKQKEKRRKKELQQLIQSPLYEADTDLLKRVINEDTFTRTGAQRIPVDVDDEAPVTDMMMPLPMEPSTGYAQSAMTPRSAAGVEEIPPMVILLCEQDEEIGANQLQAKLAAVFNANPARFAITVAEA